MFNGLRVQFVQQAAEKQIQLLVTPEDHVFYCDSILLERVLRNLLSNAVQYTSTGFVSLSCQDDADGSKLIILKDSGIGIPSENSEDVFSEYYQLNNLNRDRSKGLGLGLAIVRRLCELMDIPLEMQSQEGRGTVFRLVVPGGDPAQIKPRMRFDNTMQAKHRRVLVIDDEPQVLQGMRHMLEGWGCKVMLAESARDALKAIAITDFLPELIVSDLRLGDNQNGVDAVAAVHESLESDVPAIIISGDTSTEQLKQVKKTGLLFLHKPVAADELYQHMHALFDSSRSASVRVRRLSTEGA